MTLIGVVVVSVVVMAGLLIRQLRSFTAFLQAEHAAPIQVTLEDPDSVTPAGLPSLLDPGTKSLTIVVPAYNEEERLADTLTEALAYLQQRRDHQGPQFTYEVVVVDDGSRDGTVRVAQSFSRAHGFDTVRVLRVPVNRGKGHAVKRGMMVARGEYCLFMDADGATRFRDLELLEGALANLLQGQRSSLATGEGPLGAALGSRAHLESAAKARRSALRNFLTWGFHMCVMLVAGGRIRDTQCGFKLFTRRAAALLYSNQRLQRWCFDVELIWLADNLGVPLTEVSVQWTEMPGSKIRPTSILFMAFELLALKVAYQLGGLWHVASEAEVMSKKEQ
ncbi:dolichol-phosphate glucosyltransferase [Haematococcus lacustris]